MVTGGSSVRRHVMIAGRVQGVNFRNATKQVADQMGLRGWVKNLEDGRVEAIFEGPRDAMERMIEWCKRGPPAAQVEQVQVRPEPATGEFLRFQVQR
jgi:acylphosphatase